MNLDIQREDCLNFSFSVHRSVLELADSDTCQQLFIVNRALSRCFGTVSLDHPTSKSVFHSSGISSINKETGAPKTGKSSEIEKETDEDGPDSKPTTPDQNIPESKAGSNRPSTRIPKVMSELKRLQISNVPEFSDICARSVTDISPSSAPSLRKRPSEAKQSLQNRISKKTKRSKTDLTSPESKESTPQRDPPSNGIQTPDSVSVAESVDALNESCSSDAIGNSDLDQNNFAMKLCAIQLSNTEFNQHNDSPTRKPDGKYHPRVAEVVVNTDSEQEDEELTLAQEKKSLEISPQKKSPARKNSNASVTKSPKIDRANAAVKKAKSYTVKTKQISKSPTELKVSTGKSDQKSSGKQKKKRQRESSESEFLPFSVLKDEAMALLKEYDSSHSSSSKPKSDPAEESELAEVPEPETSTRNTEGSPGKSVAANVPAPIDIGGPKNSEETDAEVIVTSSTDIVKSTRESSESNSPETTEKTPVRNVFQSFGESPTKNNNSYRNNNSGKNSVNDLDCEDSVEICSD